jgi:hypothetical protein
VEISKLKFLAFYLNGGLGSGKYDAVSIEDVKARIRDGTVFDFLEATMGPDVDISLLYNDDRAELVREWADMADSIDEGRKLCVDRNGLVLLVAYLLEGIQRRVRNAAA